MPHKDDKDDDDHKKKHKDDFDFDDALIAAGLVDQTTGVFVQQHGFVPGSEVHVPGSGIYAFRLADPPEDILHDSIYHGTLAGDTPGFIVVACSPPDNVTVRTFNAAGVPEDRFFMITAYDLSDDD